MRHVSVAVLLALALVGHVAAQDDDAPSSDPYDQAVKDRPCLNYWQVGDAKGCAPAAKKKKVPPPQAAKPPSPTVVAAPPSDPSKTDLDKKVDDFIANHGKPPREFVQFYLDPTPQHAIEWVAKYNELLQRGQDIAVAWTQAETLYNNALQQGVSASALNPTAFAPVPDYGIPVPGFNTPAFTQLGVSGSLPAVVPAQLAGQPTHGSLLGSGQAQGSPAVPGGINPLLLQPTLPDQLATPPAPAAATGLLTPAPAVTGGKTVEVSYYFSAICPYCKRFEPGFAQLMADQDVSSKVKLTCVDVTPEMSGNTRNPSNIANRLPCTWRPATDEELSRLGIKQTPSIIVNRGADKSLELVSGYVEPATLKSYFLGGR